MFWNNYNSDDIKEINDNLDNINYKNDKNYKVTFILLFHYNTELVIIIIFFFIFLYIILYIYIIIISILNYLSNTNGISYIFCNNIFYFDGYICNVSIWFFNKRKFF